MWTWTSSTFQPWPYEVQKTRAKLSGWGGEGSGVVLVASAFTNWLPGFSILPGAKGIPFPQPNTPSVFRLSSSKLPFFSPGPSVSPLIYYVSVCVLVCVHVLYVLHCVSWHIIKGNSSEREKLNREESVPWICSGWHPSNLLCVWFLPTVALCISLVVSVLYYCLMAHRTPIWAMGTPICLEFTELIVEVWEDLELLSSQSLGD